MSYYSADYEYQDASMKKQRKKEMKEHLKKVAEIQLESRAFAPVRFMDALTDYENWLKVELKEVG